MEQLFFMMNGSKMITIPFPLLFKWRSAGIISKQNAGSAEHPEIQQTVYSAAV
jgi:hypothetical protein